MVDVERRRFLGTGLAVVGTAYLAFDRFGPQQEVRRGTAEGEARRESTVHDDNVDYVGNDTVEIVIARGGSDEPIETHTEPFSEWIERKCGDAASWAVADHLRDAFDHHLASWAGVTFEYGQPLYSALDPGVLVNYVHRSAGVDDPDRPEYEAFVRSTPRTASATVEFEGRTHRCTSPVWVQKVTRAYVRYNR